jgi:hypothetical protein
MEGKTYAGDPIDAARQRYDVEATAEQVPDQKPTRESVRGWSDEVEAELSAIQGQIDDPASTLVGLESAKKHLVAEFAKDWPDAAIKELECRFDTAILKLGGGETPHEDENEEEENEQTTD